MPIYEYACPACDATFERLRPMSAAGESAECPDCATPARRLISAFTSATTFHPTDARLPSQPAAHVGCSCCGPRRTRTTLRRGS